MASLVTSASSAIPAGRWRRPPTIDELASILDQRKTLYARRPLKNGQALIDWAISQGFTKTLPADELHVTLAYSKDPVDWNDPGINERPTSATGGMRTVEPLGDEGAIVLRFESPELSQRWKQFVDAGAHWKYDEFRPHVSITYDGKDVDLTKVDPYMGPLDFDGEVFEEIKGSGTAKAKSSMVGDEFNEADHPRDHGKFSSGGGSSGGSGEGEAKPAARAPLKERLQAHTETIKKYGKETSDWIKEEGAGKVLMAVAKNHKTKEALSVGLQSLLSHATGLDQSTWKLNEDFIEHTVHNFGNIAEFTAIQAKATMRKAVDGLLALRKGAKPTVATDADEDGVTKALEALLDALSDDEEPKEITATDSALVLALDRDSVREMDRDGRMHVSMANISKADVNGYRGHEIPGYEDLGLDPNRIYNLYRHPDELAKAVRTANGVQILRKHKPVSAEDHEPWDTIGATGTHAEFAAPYLRNSLVIWAKPDIDEIESGRKKQLSLGYHYTPVMQPGVVDGKAYDGLMTNIEVNHLAVVEDGRAGPDVVVGDSADEIYWSMIEEALGDMGWKTAV